MVSLHNGLELTALWVTGALLIFLLQCESLDWNDQGALASPDAQLTPDQWDGLFAGNQEL